MKTPYQERMSKLVVWAGFYSIAAPIGIYFRVPEIYWPISMLVYLSALAIMICIAAAADAIFDSLMENFDRNYPVDPEGEGTRL